MNTPAHNPAAALLVELDALGVQLEADRDRLRFRPEDSVTPDLAARIKASKPELLATIRKRDALDRRLAADVAELVPHELPDGRIAWTNPRYRRQLEAVGVIRSDT